MSCWSAPFERKLSNEYEEINVNQEFTFSNPSSEKSLFHTVDCKSLLNSIPIEIFDIFKFSINVCTSEQLVLQPCESKWINSNIILKPYLPLNSSFLFQGIVNGYAVKSFNQTLIQLTEEILKVKIQNYNHNTQQIPLGMPIGKIVLQSRQFCDY